MASLNRLADRFSQLKAEIVGQGDPSPAIQRMLAHESADMRLQGALELAKSDRLAAIDHLVALESVTDPDVSEGARWARLGLLDTQELARPEIPHGSSVHGQLSSTAAHPARVDRGRLAIADLLWIVHGTVMNGGLAALLEAFGNRLREVKAAYACVGLSSVAELIEEASRLHPAQTPSSSVNRGPRLVPAEHLEALDRRYSEVIRTDAALGALIGRFLDEAPEQSDTDRGEDRPSAS